MRRITVFLDGKEETVDRRLVPKDENGRDIEFLLSDIVDGMYTIDIDELENRYLANTKANLEQAIDNKIQSEINKYNTANGTTYKNIDAIPKYLYNPDYTHYTFCLAVTDWNVAVWEKARAILDDVNNGLRAIPAEAELLAELPIL